MGVGTALILALGVVGVTCSVLRKPAGPIVTVEYEYRTNIAGTAYTVLSATNHTSRTLKLRWDEVRLLGGSGPTTIASSSLVLANPAWKLNPGGRPVQVLVPFDSTTNDFQLRFTVFELQRLKSVMRTITELRGIVCHDGVAITQSGLIPKSDLPDDQ